MKIACIIRKSPTKDVDEDKSIKRYIEQLSQGIENKHGKETIVHWYIDVCSGDDELGRKQLKRFFRNIKDYDEAWCPNVDRWARSWLGLKWLHQYIFQSRCRLIFMDGTNLYKEDGDIDPEGYLFFAIKCIFAYYELIMIRDRTAKGRKRVLSDPVARQKKYKGRAKGAKDLKKRKTEGYYKK